MTSTIKIKYGNLVSNMPILQNGEMAYAKETQSLYLGVDGINKKISSSEGLYIKSKDTLPSSNYINVGDWTFDTNYPNYVYIYSDNTLVYDMWLKPTANYTGTTTFTLPPRGSGMGILSDIPGGFPGTGILTRTSYRIYSIDEAVTGYFTLTIADGSRLGLAYTGPVSANDVFRIKLRF